MSGVVIPPTVVPEALEGPTVFLAGPCHAADYWHDLAIRYLLQHAPNVNIATPRSVSYTCDFPTAVPVSKLSQVPWETMFLAHAAQTGCIMFWLAPELQHEHVCTRSYARTTRYELAEWKERYKRGECKIVVGISPRFDGVDYLTNRLTAEIPGMVIYTSLQETLVQTVKVLQEI